MAGGLPSGFELWVAHTSAVWKGGAFDFRCATLVVTTDGCQGKWCAQGDDFRTFMRDFVASLPEMEFPAEMSF